MSERAAIFARAGEFQSLAYEPLTFGPLAPHEVEIAVEAAALNFKDVLLALQLMGNASAGVPGFECVGSVRAVGADVKGLVPGDEVVAIGSACLATSVRVDSATVCRKPRRLSVLDAATMPISFVTASFALEQLANVRRGDRVLIHAATGGVGMAAVQIARRAGAEVLATAGSEAKRDFLRGLGIEHVMSSRTPAFAAEVMAATGGVGVDVVLNSLSGELLERSLEVLAPHGRFVELGARDAIAGATVALSLFRRGASYCAVGYEGPIPRLGERLAETMARAAAGEYQPLPSHAFPMARSADAFGFLAAAKHIGKVVVEIAAPRTMSARSGEELLIAPREGARLFERCLSSRRANLAISKTPLAQRFATASPGRTAAADPAAAAKRHPRPPLEVPFVAPRNDLEEKIAGAWAQHLQLDSVGVDDHFTALGGDSLLAVQVAFSIRTNLGREFPTHLLLEHPTIARLAAHLSSADTSGTGSSRLLVQLAQGPADARPIFLVHPIGGHVYFYRPMALMLAADAPVYGLQAQGVDGEAPPLETIEEMARGYIEAMRGVQPAGPYRLGGSSFGGVVCFEMAHQLAAVGETVELLALIDSPAPSSLTSFFRTDAEILGYMLAKGEDATPHLKALEGLDEDAMLRYFLEHGGAGGTLAPDASLDSVRHFLHLFQSNYRALVKYQARPLAQRGLFFMATEHDRFNTSGFEGAWDPWFEELERIECPGNHTSMNLPPLCEGIVRRIREELRR